MSIIIYLSIIHVHLCKFGLKNCKFCRANSQYIKTLQTVHTELSYIHHVHVQCTLILKFLLRTYIYMYSTLQYMYSTCTHACTCTNIH